MDVLNNKQFSKTENGSFHRLTGAICHLEGLRDAPSPGIPMAQLFLAEPSFQLEAG